MPNIPDDTYETLYRTSMAGIGFKVAMQTIRKIMRDNKVDDNEKLRLITNIVHMHEKDLEG